MSIADTSPLSGVAKKRNSVIVILVFRMEEKHFADDLPLAVGLEQRIHICELVAGPVVEFEANGGDASLNIDADNVRG